MPAYKHTPVYYISSCTDKPVVLTAPMTRSPWACMLENCYSWAPGRLVEILWGGDYDSEMGHTLVQFAPRALYPTHVNFRRLDSMLHRWVLGPEAPGITKMATLFLGPTIDAVTDECFDALVRWVRTCPLKFHHVCVAFVANHSRLARLAQAVLQSGHGVLALNTEANYDFRQVRQLIQSLSCIPSKDRFWRVGFWGGDLSRLPHVADVAFGPEPSRHAYASTRFDMVDAVTPWIVSSGKFRTLAQAYPALAKRHLASQGYSSSAELVEHTSTDASELAGEISRLFRVVSPVRTKMLAWRQCVRCDGPARRKRIREMCLE